MHQTITKDLYILTNNYTPTTPPSSAVKLHTIVITLDARVEQQIMQCEDQVRFKARDRLTNMHIVFAHLDPAKRGGLCVSSGRETHLSNDQRYPMPSVMPDCN